MRRRGALAVLAAATLAVALAATVAAHHDRAHPLAGQWRIEPDGKLFIEEVDDATGKAAISALEQDPDYWCQIRRHYYRGRFKTPTDNGPVAGCWYRTDAGTADSIGWYRSDVVQPGEIGHLDLHVRGDDGYASVTAPGVLFPVSQPDLSFVRHFKGDGAREIYLVDFKIGQHGIPIGGSFPVVNEANGTMSFRSEPQKGEVISGDVDATLTHKEQGYREIKIGIKATGPYELLNRGSRIELTGEVVKTTEHYDCPKGSQVVIAALDHRLRSEDRLAIKGKGDCRKLKELHLPREEDRLKVEIYPSYFEDDPK